MGTEFKISNLNNLLNNNKIEVPLIQRDYAQGRRGESEKRKAFLNDIKNAIDNDKEMILDYIYGTEKNGVFYPLDGQQRLTTLWLVYWYIAFVDGKLDEKGKILKKFSYKVRVSSSDFCLKLCSMHKEDWEKIQDKRKEESSYTISQYIQEQHWFYSKWIQDPTVNSMLRTISGESWESKDGIETIFGNEDRRNRRLHRLFDENQVKVKFNILKIGNKQISSEDNLYVKMNARGKRLSDYENYKSDLIDYLKQVLDQKEVDTYSLLFDTEWSDALWKNHNDSGEIDDIYFSLMNRLFLNEYIVKMEYLVDEKGDDIWKKFYNYDWARDLKYKVFDSYKEILDGRHEESLLKWNKLFRMLCYHGDKMIEDLSKISVIPTYEEYNNSQQKPSQEDRVYLHAICEFIKRIDKETIEQICVSTDSDSTTEDEKIKTLFFKEYKRWMRITGNIIDNAGIDTIDVMLKTMKLIGELGNEWEKGALSTKDTGEKVFDIEKADIYNVVANYKISATDSPRMMQLEEEKKKAGILINGFSDSDNIDFNKREELFEKAEKYAFFDGAIRFLLWDASGNYKDSYENFIEKYKMCEKLFEGRTAKQEAAKKFRKVIDDYTKVFKSGISITSVTGYDNRKFCWKKSILLNKDLAREVDSLLLGKTVETDLFIRKNEKLFDKLTNSQINNDDDQQTQETKKYVCDVYLNQEEVLKIEGSYQYIFLKRKKNFDVLVKSRDVTHVDNYCIEGYYCGKTINFTCSNNKKYSWEIEYDNSSKEIENHVYLLDEDKGVLSKNYYTWSDPDSLIDDLKKTQFIFE